jgi:alcohol dehydrogenase (cytochrome c)
MGSQRTEEKLMRLRLVCCLAISVAVAFFTCPIDAQADSTSDWITVNKDYSSQRYVDLDQITPANASALKEVCEIQLNELSWSSTGLLMVGRTLYLGTGRATYAIDPATCDLRWRKLIELKQPTLLTSRGAGYLDGMIFRGTMDGRVIALDAQTGKTIWEVQNADPTRHEVFTSAPIAWDGKVFIGIAVSDMGIRGRLMALDARTGKEIWRFYTIPIGSEPGADTWGNKAESPPAGGGFWSTYSLDPTNGEVFGPVANPYPDYSRDERPGDNLYTNSVISVNSATGKLNWYHQAVPLDDHDWDLGTAPTLYRTEDGKNMLAIAGKNGRVLGIDRATKAVVFDTPATTILNNGDFGEIPQLVCPGTLGGAQWNGTAYHPGIGALYVGMVDWCWYYFRRPNPGHPGRMISEPAWNFSVPPRGWISAMDGATGHILWQYHADAQVEAGLVPTKSGILFGGDVRGNLLVLDAKTGVVLHRIDARGALNNGLISYAIDGTQYVAAVVGGTSLNPSGVAGALRVTIFGLQGSDAPRVVKLDRVEVGATREESRHWTYAMACQNCHGPRGRNGTFPDLVRQTQLGGNPEALKAFLASVPPPMPRLYPGLLEDSDVELIAEYLKILMSPH